MRMLKKLLLAMGLIGLLGTAGFTTEVKAMDGSEKETPVIEVDGDDIILSYDGEVESGYYIMWDLGGQKVKSVNFDGEYVITGFRDWINGLIEKASSMSVWANTTVIDSISATVYNARGVAVSYTGSADLAAPLYKIKVSADGLKVTLKNNGVKTTNGLIFGYNTNEIEITVTETNILRVTGWADDQTLTQPRRVVKVNGSSEYEAITGVNGGSSDLEIILTGPDNTPTVKQDFEVKWRRVAKPGAPALDTTENGTIVTVYYDDGSVYPGYPQDTTSKKDNGSYTIKKLTYPGYYYITVEGFDSNGDDWLRQIEVYVSDAPTTIGVTTSDFIDYITLGGNYAFEFLAEAENGSTDMHWYSDSEYVSSILMGTSRTDGSNSAKRLVRVTTNGSIEAGTTTNIALKCKVNGIDASLNSDGSDTLNVVGYSGQKLTYVSENRVLKYIAPAKVNTGTIEGMDNSFPDLTRTKISAVTGIRLQMFLNGTYLGTTIAATRELGSGNNEYTIESKVLEQIISGIKDKLTDSCNLTFRALPCDTYGNYNKNIYADVTVPLYKVTVKGKGIKERAWYGMEGQSIEISAETELGTEFKGHWSDDVNIKTAVRTVTVSRDAARNTYTAVSGNVVTGITINNENDQHFLEQGKTLLLSAAIVPADAQDKEIVWSSSDTSIIRVDGNGVVTAASVGDAVITALNPASNVKGTYKVSVYIPLTGVNFKSKNLTMSEGGSYLPEVAVYPANASLRDADGKIGNASSSIKYQIDEKYLSILRIENGVFIAGNLPKGSNKVTVNITVTAKSDGNITKADTCSVTIVKKASKTSKISLNKTKYSMGKGEKVTIIANVIPTPENVGNIVWRTDKEQYVNLSTDKGDKVVVTALKEGKVKLTATINSGKKKECSCVITIGNPVASVSIDKNKTPSRLAVGKNAKLRVAVKGAGETKAANTTVEWSSSNESVVVVDKNGKITAKNPGTAEVTAIATSTKEGDQISDTVSITTYVPVKKLTINPKKNTLKEGETGQIKLTSVSPENVSDFNMLWTCSNEKVITLSKTITGKDEILTYNAKGIGTAKITGTANDGSKKKVVVNVKVVGRMHDEDVKINIKKVPSGVTVLEGTNNSKNVNVSNMAVGKKITLTPVLTPKAADKKVTFTSSVPEVATVNAKGNVVAKKAGTTVITMTTSDGHYTATCTFTVVDK